MCKTITTKYSASFGLDQSLYSKVWWRFAHIVKGFFTSIKHMHVRLNYIDIIDMYEKRRISCNVSIYTSSSSSNLYRDVAFYTNVRLSYNTQHYTRPRPPPQTLNKHLTTRWGRKHEDDLRSGQTGNTDDAYRSGIVNISLTPHRYYLSVLCVSFKRVYWWCTTLCDKILHKLGENET